MSLSRASASLNHAAASMSDVLQKPQQDVPDAEDVIASMDSMVAELTGQQRDDDGKKVPGASVSTAPVSQSLAVIEELPPMSEAGAGNSILHAKCAGLEVLQRDVAELSRLEASASRGLAELMAEVALISKEPVPPSTPSGQSKARSLQKAVAQDMLADADDMLCAESLREETLQVLHPAWADALGNTLRREFNERHSQQQLRLDSFMHQAEVSLQKLVFEVSILQRPESQARSLPTEAPESQEQPEPSWVKDLVQKLRLEVDDRCTAHQQRTEEDLGRRVTALEKELLTLREDMGKMCLDSEFTAFRDICQKSAHDQQSELTKLSEDLRSEFTLFREDHLHMASGHSTAEARVASQAHVQTLQNEISSLREDHHSLSAAVDDSSTKMSSDLRQQVEALRQEVGDMISTSKAAASAPVQADGARSLETVMNAEWQSSVQNLQSDVAKLQADHRNFLSGVDTTGTNADLCKQVEALRQELGEMTSSLRNEFEAAVIRERVHSCAREAVAEALAQCGGSLGGDYDSCQLEVDRVSQRVTTVHQELGNLAATVNAQEFGTLSAKLKQEVDVMSGAVRVQVDGLYEELRREASSLQAGLCAQSAEMHAQARHGHLIAETEAAAAEMAAVEKSTAELVAEDGLVRRELLKAVRTARDTASEIASVETAEWGRRFENHQANEIHRELVEVLSSARHSEHSKDASPASREAAAARQAHAAAKMQEAAQAQLESAMHASVVQRFAADSMDPSAMSLELGEAVEVLSRNGAWASVKTATGQTGTVPALCLKMEEVTPRAAAARRASAPPVCIPTSLNLKGAVPVNESLWREVHSMVRSPRPSSDPENASASTLPPVVVVHSPRGEPESPPSSLGTPRSGEDLPDASVVADTPSPARTSPLVDNADRAASTSYAAAVGTSPTSTSGTTVAEQQVLADLAASAPHTAQPPPPLRSSGSVAGVANDARRSSLGHPVSSEHIRSDPNLSRASTPMSLASTRSVKSLSSAKSTPTINGLRPGSSPPATVNSSNVDATRRRNTISGIPGAPNNLNAIASRSKAVPGSMPASPPKVSGSPAQEASLRRSLSGNQYSAVSKAAPQAPAGKAKAAPDSPQPTTKPSTPPTFGRGDPLLFSTQPARKATAPAGVMVMPPPPPSPGSGTQPGPAMQAAMQAANMATPSRSTSSSPQPSPPIAPRHASLTVRAGAPGSSGTSTPMTDAPLNAPRLQTGAASPASSATLSQIGTPVATPGRPSATPGTPMGPMPINASTLTPSAGLAAAAQVASRAAGAPLSGSASPASGTISPMSTARRVAAPNLAVAGAFPAGAAPQTLAARPSPQQHVRRQSSAVGF